MDDKELIEYFKSQMKEDPDMASAVAAIRTLLEYLKRDKGETIQGLRANLTSAIETLCGVDSSVAVSSGGELFLRFISLTSLEYSDYSKCKKIMIERGEIFLRRISLSRKKIADMCHTFIKDGARILTHAYSRVVLRVLEAAVAAKKRFSVYITESQPDLSGQVSFHLVLCLAVLLKSKLRIRIYFKRDQNMPQICHQLALPLTVPDSGPGRKTTGEFEVGHSTG
uniref:Translation initiation factor eIF2B subunit alpha n=2 Tax=Sus scrofa TaxID=9823 RepID=A0A8D1FK09_PIG